MKPELPELGDWTNHCHDSLYEPRTVQRLIDAAYEAGKADAREALMDGLSVCNSVSTSRDREVVRDGCVMYLQTQEWCEWAEKEVGPKIHAALCAMTPPEQPK